MVAVTYRDITSVTINRVIEKLNDEVDVSSPEAVARTLEPAEYLRRQLHESAAAMQSLELCMKMGMSLSAYTVMEGVLVLGMRIGLQAAEWIADSDAVAKDFGLSEAEMERMREEIKRAR